MKNKPASDSPRQRALFYPNSRAWAQKYTLACRFMNFAEEPTLLAELWRKDSSLPRRDSSRRVSDVFGIRSYVLTSWCPRYSGSASEDGLHGIEWIGARGAQQMMKIARQMADLERARKASR